jgi:hypothetical protein
MASATGGGLLLYALLCTWSIEKMARKCMQPRAWSPTVALAVLAQRVLKLLASTVKKLMKLLATTVKKLYHVDNGANVHVLPHVVVDQALLQPLLARSLP